MQARLEKIGINPGQSKRSIHSRVFRKVCVVFHAGLDGSQASKWGLNRLIAILCGTPSIRDMIAFPKTAKGTDLMTQAPAPVEPKQLRELGLELKVPKKE